MALGFDSIEEFDKFLATCRKYEVTTVKDGDCIIQFQPKMPDFAQPQIDDNVAAGGWKRGADLME